MRQRTMFGFKKYVPSVDVIAQAKRMADLFVAAGTDDYGEISDSSVYYEAINILEPYKDDLSVATKIMGYRNRAKKLEFDIQEALNDVTLFDWVLQETIMNTTQANYKDPQGLIWKLATLQGAALEDFDETILKRVMERIPRGKQIPKEVITYRDKLKTKSKELIDLANSYLTEDEATELPGPAVPDAYGVLVRTNPQTGNIVNFEFTPIHSLDKLPSGFKKTESRYARIPIYLNTITENGDEVARLGSAEYKYDTDKKLLELNEEGIDFLNSVQKTLVRWFRAIGAETNEGIRQQQQEFPLGSIPFDSFDIPLESVVKDVRGNYYYFGEDKHLWQAENKEMLKKYLKEIRKNPEIADSPYLGHPDFIRGTFLPDEEGEKRMIDEKFFEEVFKPKEIVTPVLPTIEDEPKPLGPTLPVIPTPHPETTPKEPPAFVEPAPEYLERHEAYDLPKIIEKGKELFRRFLPHIK